MKQEKGFTLFEISIIIVVLIVIALIIFFVLIPTRGKPTVTPGTTPEGAGGITFNNEVYESKYR